MRIPIIRMYPTGESKVVQLKPRRGWIEDLAHKFLRSGGRYIMYVHPPEPGKPNVELVASIRTLLPPHAARVAEAWCYDDPALPQAIDQLVQDSLERSVAASVH